MLVSPSVAGRLVSHVRIMPVERGRRRGGGYDDRCGTRLRPPAMAAKQSLLRTRHVLPEPRGRAACSSRTPCTAASSFIAVPTCTAAAVGDGCRGAEAWGSSRSMIEQRAHADRAPMSADVGHISRVIAGRHRRCRVASAPRGAARAADRGGVHVRIALHRACRTLRYSPLRRVLRLVVRVVRLHVIVTVALPLAHQRAAPTTSNSVPMIFGATLSIRRIRWPCAAPQERHAPLQVFTPKPQFLTRRFRSPRPSSDSAPRSPSRR